MLVQPVRRGVSLLHTGALPEPLIRQLGVMLTAQAADVVRLGVLFREATWVPLRLMLAGHRRQTNRQISRLICLLPGDNLRTPPAGPKCGVGQRETDDRHGARSAAVLVERTRALLALLAGYRPAADLALSSGRGYAASLLGRSLEETTEAASECAALARELTACPM